eukprot:3391372-Amphidinium_carterae.1
MAKWEKTQDPEVTEMDEDETSSGDSDDLEYFEAETNPRYPKALPEVDDGKTKIELFQSHHLCSKRSCRVWSCFAYSNNKSDIISMGELVQKCASVSLSLSKGEESEMFRLCDSGKLLLELLMQQSVQDSSSSHMLIQYSCDCTPIRVRQRVTESGRFWQRL